MQWFWLALTSDRLGQTIYFYFAISQFNSKNVKCSIVQTVEWMPKYDEINSLIIRATICIASTTEGNKNLILLINNFNTVYC